MVGSDAHLGTALEIAVGIVEGDEAFGSRVGVLDRDGDLAVVHRDAGDFAAADDVVHVDREQPVGCGRIGDRHDVDRAVRRVGDEQALAGGVVGHDLGAGCQRLTAVGQNPSHQFQAALAGFVRTEIEPRQDRVVIAGADVLAEVGVQVHDVDLRLVGQVGRDQDVVEFLGIAVEVEAVAVTHRHAVHQIGQIVASERLERLGEIEIVHVPEHDQVRVRVGLQQFVGEVVDLIGLEHALAERVLEGRLLGTEQRRIARFRFQVVVDDEDIFALELELCGQGFAGPFETDLFVCRECRTVRVDPAGIERQAHAIVARNDRLPIGRTGLAFRHEGHPLGIVEVGDPNVGTGLAAIRVVLRVDLDEVVGRPAGERDAVDQACQGRIARDVAAVGRAVAVLDLLQGDDVRAVQPIDDVEGQTGELVVAAGVGRTVGGVEVQHVEGGDGQGVVATGKLAASALQTPRRHLGQGSGVEQLEVAETVVEHALDRAGELVADIHLRRVGHESVVDDDPFGVGVVRLQRDATRVGAHVRPGTAVREDRDLAEPVGRAYRDAVVDFDAHALQALVEVDGVIGGIEIGQAVVVDDVARRLPAVRTDHDRRRQVVAAGEQGAGVQGDLGGGEIAAHRTAGDELANRAADLQLVAHGHVRGRPAEHEDRVRGRLVAVAGRVLQVEAVAADRRHDAGDLDAATEERREMVLALDLRDRRLFADRLVVHPTPLLDRLPKTQRCVPSSRSRVRVENFRDRNVTLAHRDGAIISTTQIS